MKYWSVWISACLLVSQRWWRSKPGFGATAGPLCPILPWMVIASLLQALSISTDCHYLIRIPWLFSCQEWFLKLPFLTEFGAHQGMMRKQRVPKEHFQRCLSLVSTNEIKSANAHKPRNILSCCTHIKTYLYWRPLARPGTQSRWHRIKGHLRRKDCWHW